MLYKNVIALSISLILLISINSNAQSYETAIGLRLGGISSGITVKHFMNSTAAMEGILSFNKHSLMLAGLYEKHYPFPKVEGLSWFYGGGAHLGLFNNDYGYEYFYYKGHHNKVLIIEHANADVSFGLDFIIGLDYKITNTPINICLDVKPFFDLLPGFYGYWEGAFSLRFTF